MPRQPRLVVPDIAHHLTQRGNYGQQVFDEPADFSQYCTWVNEGSNKNGLRVLAYCLMPNHVHFIVRPESRNSMARVFNTVHMRYSQHANRKRNLKGHLWQARFFSCLLDDRHLYRAIRYVERNPVRAGLARTPWEYRWSSAPAHAAAGPSPIMLAQACPIRTGAEWREYIGTEDQAMLPQIRAATSRGALLGADDFRREIEMKLGRPVLSRNPGRPFKSGQARNRGLVSPLDDPRTRG